MGERSLAQRAYEAYWRSMGHNEPTAWNEKEECVRAAWTAAAAAACAPGEGQTSADLRSVADVLRVQLAEAQAEMERLRGAEQAADKHIQTLEAQLADVRAFANFEANKARRLAEQLRSGPVTCAKWVEGEDGHRLVIPETLLGSVLDSDPSDSSVSWRVEPTFEWGVQSGTVDDRGNVAAAQRIVETLTGVRR